MPDDTNALGQEGFHPMDHDYVMGEALIVVALNVGALLA